MVTLKTKPMKTMLDTTTKSSSFPAWSGSNRIIDSERTMIAESNAGIAPMMQGRSSLSSLDTNIPFLANNTTTNLSSSRSVTPTLTLSLGNGIHFVVLPSTNSIMNAGGLTTTNINNGTVSFQQDPNNPNEYNLQLIHFTGCMKIVQQPSTEVSTCSSGNHDEMTATNKCSDRQFSDEQRYTKTPSSQRDSHHAISSNTPKMVHRVTPKNSIGVTKSGKTSKKKIQSKGDDVKLKTKFKNPSNSFVENKIETTSSMSITNNANDNELPMKRCRRVLESADDASLDNHHHDQPSQSLLVLEESEQQPPPSLGQYTQTQHSYATNTIDDDDDDDEHNVNTHYDDGACRDFPVFPSTALRDDVVTDHRPSKIQRILEEGTVGSEENGGSDDKTSVVEQGVDLARPSMIVLEESPLKATVGGNEQKDVSQIIPKKNIVKRKDKINKLCNVVAESSPVTTIPAKGHEPPAARWGHTITLIGDNRFVLYGGQTFDENTLYPKTLSDLYIYDIKKNVWYKPFNCENGVSRQWHTCTFLPNRNLLISFGGETMDPKTGKSRATDQVMALDTEIMLWYPPTINGDIPTGRSGHTATFLSLADSSSSSKMNDFIVVFGGVLQGGRKWSNSVAILDTNRWIWSTAPKVIQGSAPKPRSYHSAVAIGSNRIVYFGGNDAVQSFNSVHILEVVELEESNHDNVMLTCSSVEEKKKSKKKPNEIKKIDCNGINYGLIWKHPTVSGAIPAPRTGQTATLLYDEKSILIYGGWDPKADDETQGPNPLEDDKIYDTVYMLNTETWVWTVGPPAYYAIFPTAPSSTSDYNKFRQCQDGGPKRVGHQAVLIPPVGDLKSTTKVQEANRDSQRQSEGVELDESEAMTQSPIEAANDNAHEGTDLIKHNLSASSKYGEILVFGGRIPGDKFTGDFQIIAMEDN